MTKTTIKAYIAGLLTLPFLVILGMASTASGELPALMNLLENRTFGLVLNSGYPVVINARKKEMASLNVTAKKPPNLSDQDVTFSKDNGSYPEGHTHPLEDGIYEQGMTAAEARIRHYPYAHCWVQINKVWTQIHC